MNLSSIFKRIRDWWNDQKLRDALDQSFRDNNAILLRNEQLLFLVSQAPMQNAPLDSRGALRAVTKFAYVHPETINKLTDYNFPADRTQVLKLNPSLPTIWVATPLMPKYGVIYTPNLMPGFESNAIRNSR